MSMVHWQGGTGLAEASDLGFRPGAFPEAAQLPCADGSLREFVRTGVKRRDGEVTEVTYRRREDGLAVVVFND